MPEIVELRTVAPAKINWTLEVLGRRSDGFHEIRTILQTVDFGDHLSLRPASAFELSIEGPEAGALTPDDNLVTRALQAFPSQLERQPVAVLLRKSTPAAAGLGGGSSDAAAAIRLAQRLWKSPEDEGAYMAAAALGADVPFFLRGGVQLGSGRGEILTALPTPPSVRLVIATPPIFVEQKTARLYAALKPAHFSDGAATVRLAQRIRQGDVPRDEDYVNVFDRVADAVFPRLSEYRQVLERVMGTRPMLAGAGPSLFAIFAPKDVGEELERRDALSRSGLKVWFTQTTNSAAATAREWRYSV